jgi:predicted membrane metal-binding protein
MINHSFNSNTIWYFDDAQDCFILQATEDIQKGIEIVDDYGDKSNVNLLLFYGFTLSNNPFPILRTSITDVNNNIIYLELTLDFNLTNIMDKFESKYNFLIEQKLNEIKKHHEKQLKQFDLNKYYDCNSQYNNNIANIYLDEINIITRIMKQIKHK